MNSSLRQHRRILEERRLLGQVWRWPSSPAEYRDRVEALPAAFRRTPQVADFLLSHGSLEDDSPTLSALKLLKPQLLIEAEAPGDSRLKHPTTSVQDYEQWINSAEELLPWQLRRIRALHRGEGHIWQMLLELNRAFQVFGLTLNPAPHNVLALQWYDACLIQGLDLGKLELAELPVMMICPACGWSGGGGQLQLFRMPGNPSRHFQCDEEDNIYDEYPFPWFQPVNRRPLPPAAAWGIPYSVLGTDYQQIRRVISQTWEDRMLLRPPVSSPSGSRHLVLQSREPLGPWNIRVFDYCVIPAGDTTRIAVTSLGPTLPDAAEQAYQWWSRTN